jgi:hypothetical protein
MGTIFDMVKKVEDFHSEFESFIKKPMPLAADAKGMIDRQCPKDTCGLLFKVNFDDWKNVVKDIECFCPACRNNAPASDYLPISQREALVKNIRKSIMDNWNYDVPMAQGLQAPNVTEEFEVAIQCEKCNVRFSVLGAAYFCPCCGYNSVERTAINAITKIIYTAQKIGTIQKSLENSHTKDDAAVITRRIIESAVSACIGTLQSLSETKYNQLSSTPAPFNAFQNVDKSDKLWLALKGHGYAQWLSAIEIQQLRLFTQRRHLLEHKGGIIDAKYLTATNDTGYAAGERLIIQATDIILLGEITAKAISAISQLT